MSQSPNSSQQYVPVLLGSSFRNVGVQPLLDAVTKFLPNPVERLPANVELYSPHLCALAFKVHFDPQRGGLLTYVRVYSGTLEQVNGLPPIGVFLWLATSVVKV